MIGLSVPELRRKLQLLVETGQFASRAEIAAALGRSEITLRGWVNGSSGTPPDTVPSRTEKAFRGLYARALPDLSEDRVRELLLGPADDLENLLRAAPDRSLRDLLVREADRASAALFLDESGSLSLVRRARREKGTPQFHVEIGQAFRIEFSTRSRAVFALALQAAPGGWGVVPCTFDRDRLRIHLPGAEENGEVSFLIEDNEIGRHLFIAAQAPSAFPAELLLAGRDGIPPDRTLLAHFQRHFEAQEKSARRLFAVEIEFTEKGVS
ncbi:hypothetical protein BYZ73_00480 [Rhodovulum viride]|uniref:Uncharacterized protein n=1 Tax=Rhodovulum viride TaxID=1231134 RepID=A0ABX9DPB9_9RHOB|nr:hypothetical protein [Rhodovulum viride]RAP43221.1 hypothetical protein BYZ73_00480 [Rhodovulum viride]